jgi:hypothetical protein
MADGSQLAFLTTCGNSAEAGALRSRLEAEGIPCVVQGEQHHAMLGSIYGGVIDLRVLVPEAALERARELMASWESGGEEEDGEEAGEAPEGLEAGAARCADHGSPSIGTCLRCGAFVCEACVGGDTEELVCPACEARGAKPETPQHRTRRARATIVLAWMALPLLLAFLLAILAGGLQVTGGR